MNAVAKLEPRHAKPLLARRDEAAPHLDVKAPIANACARIAPLWPLKDFVAVNPFLGFSGQGFAQTCATMRRVAGIDMLMPRSFYQRALAEGVVVDEDLVAARRAMAGVCTAPDSLAALRLAINTCPSEQARPRTRIATIAETLDALADGDRHASRTDFMVSEISRWCAAYFDEGQALWQMPSRDAGLYRSWRMAMVYDRNAEAMGIGGFRNVVAAMHEDPIEAIAEIIATLGIPKQAITDYLHRALLDINGWAGYARYCVWQSDLRGNTDDTLVQLLAIRVVWGFTLYQQRTDDRFRNAWRDAMATATRSNPIECLDDDPELAIDLIAHCAYEAAAQRRWLKHFASTPMPEQAAPARAWLQAAFCIDVRSEVYRRALESVCPEAETLGFAGFFGFAVEYVRLGCTQGDAHCPALLKPSLKVRESVRHATTSQTRAIIASRWKRSRVAAAWKAFKLSAVSSFSFVESAGPLFAARLILDSAGRSSASTDPKHRPNSTSQLAPDIEPEIINGVSVGIDANQRLDMAEGLLRGMSLTHDFASWVMLAGHGSTSVNNPHAAGLNCGACGGHSGEPNARIAAAVLNDPEVRIGLRTRGITIPDDTWFIACLHDTTTDDVRIFDMELLPPSHARELATLQARLAQASSIARRERAAKLGVADTVHVDARITARSRDWSQVRPEWGLAGNCAFIAAPRQFTRGIPLDGRAFLHSYDWRDDNTFGVLEAIMTAPLVVASWINLQYFASTTNNRVLGAGNKVLHNVVGTIGVIEGNAGDLKSGLPLQSVHDGDDFVHEPLRLSALIAAPMEAINAAIAKHTSVRELVDNGWIHLFAMDDFGKVSHRYRGHQVWEALS